MRVLRDVGALLEVQFYKTDDPETAIADAESGVTVDVIREDGTVIVDGAAATDVDPDPGLYRYTLAPQSQLDVLTVEWTGTFGGVGQTRRTTVEIVGGHYLALADIRGLSGLSDTTKYPTSKLEAARDWFEDLAELHLGEAFVPRYVRELLDGNGQDTIHVRKHTPVRSLIKATLDGTIETTTDWAVYPHGKIVRDSGLFTVDTESGRNVSIAYEHGKDEPDAELREAAKTAIRAKLIGDRTQIPERATTMSTEAGTFTLALAGQRRPTGIPEVDSVLTRRTRVLMR